MQILQIHFKVLFLKLCRRRSANFASFIGLQIGIDADVDISDEEEHPVHFDGTWKLFSLNS